MSSLAKHIQADNIDIQHRYIYNSNIRLHVAVAGQGNPVILLHGFPENWHSWRHQIAPLVEAGFSVWMPDMRGYNFSDIPSERHAYHLRHLADDVAVIVAATRYPRAHIAGHDWGGIVTWTFAGVYPELLNKLVILNAPHMKIYNEKVWRTSQFLRSWYVLLFQLPGVPEWLLSSRNFDQVRRMFAHRPVRQGAFSIADIEQYISGLSRPEALTAALNYYRVNLHSDGFALARAARTSAPTLVIWGELDHALGICLLEGLEQVASNIKIHRIANAGHWIQNEAPGEVNQVMVNFLTQSPC